MGKSAFKKYVILVKKRYPISKNLDVRNAESRFDTRNSNIAWIVKNSRFTIYKAEVYGFTKVL